MRFFEVSDTLTIGKKKINSISTIQSKIESQLNKMKARTTVKGNEIAFKTINIILATDYIDTNTILLRIYKEGRFVIDDKGKSLKINWAVKLDTLYFLAFITSTVTGIIASMYLSVSVFLSISVGIAFFLTFVVLGILLIKYIFTDLIYKSVYPNYQA